MFVLSSGLVAVKVVVITGDTVVPKMHATEYTLRLQLSFYKLVI